MVEKCIPITIVSAGIENLYLYIAAGVAAVAIAGTAAYFLVFKKKEEPTYRYSGTR